jgi:hypothetical protein
MMEIAHQKSNEIRWKPPHECFVRKKMDFALLSAVA